MSTTDPINQDPTPIQLREMEIAQYEQNISAFEAIRQNLPTEWPQHLIEYRYAPNKHEVITTVSSMDDVVLLSQLWYADECYARIRTETLEMTKSKSILAAMLLQQP